MADYNPTIWVPEVTKVGATNLNKMEAGIEDASEHHRRGTLAARPAASALNKNHIYWAYDTGEQFISDGASWLPHTTGNGGLQDGAVTLAKLAASVTSVLPSAGEKATFANIPTAAEKAALATVPSNPAATPSGANRYTTEGERSVVTGDMGAGATTVSWWHEGLCLIEIVYGSARGHTMIGGGVTLGTRSTADGATRFGFILVQNPNGAWSYDPSAYLRVFNVGTTFATFGYQLGVANPGSIRVFSTRLRPAPAA